jgi:hypothetical protein
MYDLFVMDTETRLRRNYRKGLVRGFIAGGVIVWVACMGISSVWVQYGIDNKEVIGFVKYQSDIQKTIAGIE